MSTVPHVTDPRARESRVINPNTGRASHKRKPEIRRAATQQFRKHSYSGTSMDMIAAALNLNKGTLYHYYRGKSEILFDIVLLPLRSLADIIDTIPDDLTLQEQFRTLIRVSVEQSVEWNDEIGVYFQEMRWLTQWLDADQIGAVRKYENRYSERIRTLLMRAQRSGEFTDIDPTAVRHAIAGMNGFVFSWFDPDGRLTVAQIAEEYSRLVLDGLITRRASTDA